MFYSSRFPLGIKLELGRKFWARVMFWELSGANPAPIGLIITEIRKII